MTEIMLKVISFQFIIIFILLLCAYFIIKYLKSYEYEKKFSEFSLLSNKDTDISFFDIISRFFWKCIHKLSKIISKSEVIKKHSSVFDKDVNIDNKNIKTGMDFISIKVLCGIGLDFLFLITLVFQYIKFDFMKLLIIFIIGYLIPNIIISIRRQKRKEKIEDDLLKAIIIMNNSFKSGRNIMQAIETVKIELEGPIADEFKKISLDISYGLSLDTVFNRFYTRVKLEDAKYIATSLTLLNKTGGNIVKVFSMIEQSFFDKKKLKNELKSLTASSTFVYRVLIFLPIVFIILINVLNNEYFLPLFSSVLGFIAIGFILILYVSYVFIVRKALKVEM